MARNVRKYGYGPNRSSDAPYRIVLARHRHAYERQMACAERRAARLRQMHPVIAPGTPLTDDERVWNYVRQIGARRPLTPRQQRRRTHNIRRAIGLQSH